MVASCTAACGCFIGQCEPGWVQFRDHCYKFVPRSKLSVTFHEAEAYCQGFSTLNGTGHLASVQDQDENDFILDIATMAGMRGNFWIGFTDTQNEGTFVWTDGSPTPYKNWRSGSPDDGGSGRSEDQAEMSSTREWNDTNGDSKTLRRGFMCKMPVFDKKKFVTRACSGK
ncbi:echinoidin-like [Patiria miniata]|uniref:C-type lectin domain-containing protein n=1 Tax=Patiria miniata TaxID=46514 RepID=A0A914A6U8_PATMI|nr:echinoidin-like [Patiria miniata]